jgi:hypothetical protein
MKFERAFCFCLIARSPHLAQERFALTVNMRSNARLVFFPPAPKVAVVQEAVASGISIV